MNRDKEHSLLDVRATYKIPVAKATGESVVTVARHVRDAARLRVRNSSKKQEFGQPRANNK